MAYLGHMTSTQMNPSPRFTVHDRCLKARKDAELEQQELADRIEVSRQTISNYETGRITRPTKPTLRRWALTCGVTFEWLYAGEDFIKPRSSTSRNRNGRRGVSPGNARPGGTRGPALEHPREDGIAV